MIAPHPFHPDLLSALDALLALAPSPERYAVVDWDNTSIFGDIQDAVLAHQCETLAIKMAPDELAQVLSAGLPEDALGPDCVNASGQPVTLEMLAADIAEDFALAPHDARRKRAMRARLRFLYASLDAHLGHVVSCTWIPRLYAGMTPDEVHALTHQAIAARLEVPVSQTTWSVPAGSPGRSGVVESTWQDRLRIQAPMCDLYGALHAAGVAVYVVSASFEEIVRPFACDPRYGYGVAPDRVYGMKLQMTDRGTFTPRMCEDMPPTQAEGKAQTITQCIAPRHGGAAPVLIAGDSEGDVEMMTRFGDEPIRLVLNRACAGAMGALARAHEDASRHVILQGRDERDGTLRPESASIFLDGTTRTYVP